MSLAPGTHLGSYQILGLLGHGGMGCVYRALDFRLGREVAIKLMTEAAASNHLTMERFSREAVAASALNHPNIITVFEFVASSDHGPYLVTELIDGETLRRRLSERPSPETAISWCRQMAKALKAAHEGGIVHRDLKPDNIMVRRDGYVKILDFGIARLAPKTPQSETLTVTVPGTLLGTLRYMSPEQVRGESVGAASDVFSLGLVWFELLTGSHPFGTGSPVSVIHGIASLTPVRPSRLNPAVPSALDSLILRMLEKDPCLRPTADEIDRALAEPGIERLSIAPDASPSAARSRSTVGREVELEALRRAYDSLGERGGHLIGIAGEAGIGKTTVVESFLAEVESGGDGAVIGVGRCSERLAGTEAYLPFLESLDQLIHKYPGSAPHLMKLHAPMWYGQVASATEDDPSVTRMISEARVATQARLKLELNAFLRELSAQHPLILFFDDLHWADTSTIDLLVHAASQFQSMRVLIVATYRPSDMLLAKHPFVPVRLSLQAKGLCSELALVFLTCADVEKYLAITFPEHDFPAGFAPMLHARTDGSPLFVVDLVRYLRDRGVLQERSGRWSLTQPFAELAGELPVSVRSMVQRKIEQLSEDDQKLLACGSVQGYEFDSTIVADVLEVDPAEVEERLDFLDKVHSFVRIVGEVEQTDGALSVRYRFVHALYQNALYASLRPTRRASLSLAVAGSLENRLGSRRESKASELAFLFERARKFQPAAQYFLIAARNAASLFAAGEAATLAQRGLSAATMMPDSETRSRLSLDLEVTLSSSLRISKGNAAAETGASMLRARELAERLSDTQPVPALLWGLFLYCQVGGDLTTARHYGEQLLHLGEQSGDASVLLGGHTALGITCVHLAELPAGHQHLEQAVTIHDPRQHDAYVELYNLDPGVYSRGVTHRTLWLLGYADRARKRTEETQEWSRHLSDPQSIAFALVFATFFHQLCGEVHRAGELADACIALCDEHGIVQEREWVAPVRGWVMARQGKTQEGIAYLRQSLARHRAMQSLLNFPYFLAMLIELLLAEGEIPEGLEAVEEALQVVERTQQRSFLAEIYRLKGELLRAQDADSVDAEMLFERAMDIAENQSALALQLRAGISLCRATIGRARGEESYAILERIYSQFDEGFDTPDLVEAKALLDQRDSRGI